MAGFRIEGNTSGNVVEVDANHAALVNLPTVINNAGYVANIFENDSGAITGIKDRKSVFVSDQRRLSCGTDTVVFSDCFNATAQNTTIWKSAATTLTYAFSGGYVNFNSALNTAAGSQVYQSWKTFSLFGGTPLMIDISGALTATPPANFQMEVGLFSAAIGTAPYTPTDGVYYRVTSSGIVGVINYNGSETTTGVLVAAASILLNTNQLYRIIITQDLVKFWSTDANGASVLLGTLPVPTGVGQPMAAAAQPISIRFYQPGVAGAPISLKISNVSVYEGDTSSYKPWSHQMAGMGLNIAQGQNGGTLGTTALYSNSLGAGAGAVMTNTTAALGTGLGGQFSALPTLAAGTDGIVCSYLNPVGSVSQTPRTIFITSISIAACVTTVLVGNATPVVYFYSLAFGGNAVTLAQTESVVNKAYRRVPLGSQSFAAAAAVGTKDTDIYRTFDPPIPVNAGEYIALAAKNVGVVTTTGVVTFLVGFTGYED